MQNSVRVLLIKDTSTESWSAQCLEYDIATQAKELTALLDEVQRVLNAHLRLSEKLKIAPFANLKSAPPVFWLVYNLVTLAALRLRRSVGVMASLRPAGYAPPREEPYQRSGIVLETRSGYTYINTVVYPLQPL